MRICIVCTLASVLFRVGPGPSGSVRVRPAGRIRQHPSASVRASVRPSTSGAVVPHTRLTRDPAGFLARTYSQ
eukprot:6489311-Prymnesium_polylepis.1